MRPAEHWVSFSAGIDGPPRVVTVDAGWMAALPVAGLDSVLAVDLPYDGGDTGMPDPEVFGGLLDLLDRVADRLELAGTPLLGRVTGGGRVQAWFACADTAAAAALVRPLLAGRRAEVQGQDDPGWTVYRGVLYPSRRGWREIADREVLENLARHGDPGTAPRPIDHAIVFADAAAAQAMADDLAPEGFTHRLVADRTPGEVWLDLTRTDVPRTITRLTAELEERAEARGARYDGWGAPVRPEAVPG